jgi:hypothetical protein
MKGRYKDLLIEEIMEQEKEKSREAGGRIHRLNFKRPNFERPNLV